MINSKQRAELRSLAGKIDPVFQVGKSGIGDALIKQVDDALTARELIKLTVLETSPDSARVIADEIAARTESEVVCVIGRKAIFWRRNKKEPKIMLKCDVRRRKK